MEKSKCCGECHKCYKQTGGAIYPNGNRSITMGCIDDSCPCHTPSSPDTTPKANCCYKNEDCPICPKVVTQSEECNCKEMSCKVGCEKRHTHKGYFCEKCNPPQTEEVLHSKEDLVEDWVERFDKEFTSSYAGDSGFGGNDPQEPIYIMNTDDPNDIKSFIKQEISSNTERVKRQAFKEGYNLAKEEIKLSNELYPEQTKDELLKMNNIK